MADVGQAFVPIASRVVGMLGSMTTQVAGWFKENSGSLIEYGHKFLDFFAV